VRCDVKRADRRAEDPSKAPSDEEQNRGEAPIPQNLPNFQLLEMDVFFPQRVSTPMSSLRVVRPHASDAEVRPTSRRANPLLPFHSCPHRPPPPRTPRGSPRAVRRDASPSPFRPALLLAAPVNGCPLTPRPAHDRRGVPRARRREAGRGCPAWTSPSWSPASAAAWR
jgi:hypothetical protein